jgi:NDP-sugar pyrophosphorylase family protein
MASLAIEINGRKAKALMDSGASHNFIHPRLISQETHVHPKIKIASSAVNRAEFQVKENCTLQSVTTASTCNFCVILELCYDVVLGRNWLMENQVEDFRGRRFQQSGENSKVKAENNFPGARQDEQTKNFLNQPRESS